VLDGLPQPFTATRYHSLAVEDPPAAEIMVNGRRRPGRDGDAAHRAAIDGVQFHPIGADQAASHACNWLAAAV